MFLFKIARRVMSFLLLIVIIVPVYVAGNIWWSAHHVGPKPSDAIVVLGAAEDNGNPTPILAQRITQARMAYESGLAPVIITVGGGQKGDIYTEASASYRSLLSQGFTKKHLVELPVGKDTLTSTIAYVAYMKLHNWKSVIITTDPYHCYRAVAEASDLGVQASCNPVQAGPGSLGATGIRYIVRETGAYLAYKTVGRFGIHLSDQVKK
jgi:vancomycin permeability regulator SanA